MKYAISVIGIILAMLGMAGFESNMLLGFLFIVIGGLLIVPYFKEWEKEEERRNRRESNNRGMHRSM